MLLTVNDVGPQYDPNSIMFGTVRMIGCGCRHYTSVASMSRGFTRLLVLPSTISCPASPQARCQATTKLQTIISHRKTKRKPKNVLEILASTVEKDTVTDQPYFMINDGVLGNSTSKWFAEQTQGAIAEANDLAKTLEENGRKHVLRLSAGNDVAEPLSPKQELLRLLAHEQTKKALVLYRKFKNNEDFDLHLYNSLLLSISRLDTDKDLNKWKLAEEVLYGITCNNIRPDASTFNILMDIAFTSSKNSSTVCLQLIREMKSIGILPTLGTFYHLLRSLHGEGGASNEDSRRLSTHSDVPNIQIVLHELRRGPIQKKVQHPDDLQFYNFAMMCTQSIISDKEALRTQIGTELVNYVTENNLLHLVGEKYRFFGDFLGIVLRSSLNRDAASEFVLEIYRFLVPSFFVPSSHLYRKLFEDLCLKGNIDHLPTFFNDMLTHKLPLEHVAPVIIETISQNPVPDDRLLEYLSIAITIDNRMGVEKCSERASLILQLLCRSGDFKEARRKLDGYLALKVPLSDEIVVMCRGRNEDGSEWW